MKSKFYNRDSKILVNHHFPMNQNEYWNQQLFREKEGIR